MNHFIAVMWTSNWILSFKAADFSSSPSTSAASRAEPWLRGPCSENELKVTGHLTPQNVVRHFSFQKHTWKVRQSEAFPGHAVVRMEPDPDMVPWGDERRGHRGPASSVTLNVLVGFYRQPVQSAPSGPLDIKVLETKTRARRKRLSKPKTRTEDIHEMQRKKTRSQGPASCIPAGGGILSNQLQRCSP